MLTAVRDKDPSNILAAEDLVSAKSMLGGVLADAHRPEAIAVLEPLRAEVLNFIAKHPDDFNVKKSRADVHNDLGKALRVTHRPDAALREHLAARAIVEAILLTSPEDGIARKIRIISLIRGANAELDRNRFPAALVQLDQAQQTLDAMIKAAPADAMFTGFNTEATKLREEIQKKVR